MGKSDGRFHLNERWDYVRMDLRENGLQGGEWIDLAYDRKKMVCRAESGLIWLTTEKKWFAGRRVD